MRLTQLKLAGFKTFVDPTTIHFPGQRVGVVGPNGCGKSNVIDAMRWVLGESSARQLRGGSMQDVIFNGSGTRKPVSRASVEMVFDNSLGKAAGQWSQYAEVAVKRVLHRDGESGYYINNLHVRRRDITDIFLGTGLGARAYAIIEQGMISRIIEARPEELRVFLEEAAGISKYKERRRETETRLKDTRENLLRVDDIRQELAAQLLKLEAQAEVARLFLDLKQRLELAHNLFHLFKKREAQVQTERWRGIVTRLVNELEAETAALRQAESLLEQTREAHYAGTDVLHAAQGELYGANAEVARVEQSLQHSRENRQRLGVRIAAAREQEARLTKQREENQDRQARSRAEQEQAAATLEESRERLEQETGRLPLAEQAFRDCRQSYDNLQRRLNEARQAAQVEETHRAHAEKMLQSLHMRQGRLQQEKNALPHFDADALAEKEEELSELALQLETGHYTQETLQEQLPATEAARREAGHALQTARERITRLEAQSAALSQMQNRLDHNHKLQTWLAKHQLENLPRLWQNLSVEPGWDNALESVLRERLNAVLVDDLDQAGAWLEDPPPGMFTASEDTLEDRGQKTEDRFQAESEGGLDGTDTPSVLCPLLSVLSNPPAFLADSLHGVYIAQDPHAALAARARLAPGMLLVTREGHLFSRSGVSFYAPQSELHGVLGRQREIDRLELELAAQQEDAQQIKHRLEQAEAALTGLQHKLADTRATLAEYQQRHHKWQIEVLRLSQIGQQVAQRAAKIDEELEEVAAQLALESEQSAASRENLEQARMQIEALDEQLESLRQARTEAENRLERQRITLREVERAAQEADFFERGCRAKIDELGHFLQTLTEQFDNIHVQLEELLEEQLSSGDEPLQLELQQALELQREREQALATARNTLEAITAQLRETEGKRLRHEQQLNPLRDQMGDARLKEQEAHLAQEQFSTQLAQTNADEEALAPLLEKVTKASVLQAEIVRLDSEIEALGAVNLAALEELQNARERLGYLESQANDLNEAMETLEQAIRRIDRETRERMQATFDQVNLHLSELFPLLFGGGHAQLVMTGEEILDAGVQMNAQPPGKRNSSIHLLSGGEKALTALALTFSLFQLNPAPFCLLDEVDAPLDDSNTERFCALVKKMSQNTQFIFISHNKITMEMAEQLIGVTMQEQGVSRVVAVDVEGAMKMNEAVAA